MLRNIKIFEESNVFYSHQENPKEELKLKISYQ